MESPLISTKNELLAGSYLSIPANDLLQEFGKGKHKPGSGSAAAFQGLIAAELLRTVIILTNKEKRRKEYEQWLPKLLRIFSEIDIRIIPRLRYLFEEDSVEFGKYITIFKTRSRASDPRSKLALKKEELRQLTVVTEIPLEIANLCRELFAYAEYVFDHGFVDAAGDASVALNGALASVGGCLSIIDLNLSKFGSNEWTTDIRVKTDALRMDHRNMTTQTLQRLSDYEVVCRRQSFRLEISEFQLGKWEGRRLSDKQIEEIARHLQNTLWTYRDLIWRSETVGSHIDVLKPEIVIEQLLGYEFKYTALGSYKSEGKKFAIAGQIDKAAKSITISTDFSPVVQNFTTAHELGHAILHRDMVLHRDRSLDGSTQKHPDIKESQANRFATFFLMPAKQVRAAFRDRFLMERLPVNTDTLFLLGLRIPIAAFKTHPENLRKLTIAVASGEHFKGNTFQSMADLFNVSEIAMAIRLEELELIVLQ